jgi:hypothetical protein
LNDGIFTSVGQRRSTVVRPGPPRKQGGRTGETEFMNRIVPFLIAAILSWTGVAHADEQSAVRGTIEAQLEAFRDGDAAAAYAFAAPAIKRMFPTPERFARMVRRGYAPVYEGNAPVFLRSRAIGEDGYAQEVGFTDSSGQSWTALYTLALQPDGSWRITGCYLRKSDGPTI